MGEFWGSVEGNVAIWGCFVKVYGGLLKEMRRIVTLVNFVKGLEEECQKLIFEEFLERC